MGRAELDEHVSRLTGAFARHGTAVVPLLHAWRRAAVLEEAVREPRLEQLIPIAPFHRYLAEMRGASALTFGRRYARKYLGYEPLRGAARHELDRGWERLLGLLPSLIDNGVAVVPGSDATGISLVPGYALHAELALWDQAGVPRLAILTAVTSLAAKVVGAFGHGRIVPGCRGGVLELADDPTGAPSLLDALGAARFAVEPRPGVGETTAAGQRT